jgi:hypothetical protein
LIFTLNQDLFVETFFTHDRAPSVPGLSHARWFSGSADPVLDEGNEVRLPDESALPKIRADFDSGRPSAFSYVKLHGSITWRSASGSDMIVLGTTKSETIRSEPLLAWYLTVFEQALFAGDRALLTIGYGFRDEHINEILARGIRDHGLRLFVLSPRDPRDFKNDLMPIHGVNAVPAPRGEELWSGLAGYYCGTVKDFYIANYVRLPARGEQLLKDLGVS